MNILAQRRHHRHNFYISPGEVGSVGDVLGSVRLKHSAPELAIRWEPGTVGKAEERLGSGVCRDHPRVYDSNWESGRSFKVDEGWVIQDLRAPDTLVEPYVGSTFDYSWRNKIATVYEAQRGGEYFLTKPGPYQQSPGEINRGGSVPRVTDIEPGDLSPRAYESVVVQGTENLYGSAGRQHKAPMGRMGMVRG